MSFTRANPSGWSLGAKLTSAQINLMDANIANALDKSLAGDQLSGLITFTGGQIQANQASAIEATIAQGISATVASGIQSNAQGGIALSGGSSDEIQYINSTRTVVLAWPFIPLGGLTSGWAVGTTYGTLTGPGDTNAGQTIALGPIPMHNGSTLTNVRVFITVGTHTGLPATMPHCEVHRFDLTTATDSKIADVSASAATFSAWNATTFWDVAVSANNVIDRTQYYYYLQLADEFGTNAVSSNNYNGVELTMGSIGSMAFA